MSETTFERRLDARLLISVISTGLMSFTGIATETAMNVSFPTLMHEFNIPTSTVQWVTTINLLMLAIIIPTSSWLKKCFRTKTLFLAAWLLFVCGTLLGMWSPSFPVLIAGRMLQGMGTGMTLPMMSNIILEQVPYKNTATVMGFATLIIVLGPAIGPALGGFIVSIAGWRMVFGVLLPVLAIAAIGGLTCIRQSSVIRKEPFDVLGFFTLAASFVCLIFSLNNIGRLGLTHPLVLGLFLLAMMLLWLFTRHCRKREKPLLKLSILHNRCYRFCLIALLLCQFFTLSRGFMIPNLFQLSGGLSAFQAGCIPLTGCFIGAMMNPFSGRIYDTIGPRLPITVGFTLIVTDLVVETLFMVHVSSLVMIAIYIIYSLGQSLALGNTTTFALRNLPGDNYADGTAVINTMQQLFGAMGTTTASTIVALGQAAQPDNLAAGTATGTQWALYLLVMLSILMYISAMTGLRSGKRMH